MRKSWDVIIIGAGIIGLSIAYYLRKRGCERVLILEKEENWIAGSTARANGGFRQQFSTPVNIRMSQISVPVFEHFSDEFGVDIALRQYGYLFVTATEEGERALRHNLAMQRRHGVQVDWLEPREIAEMVPFVRTDDLRGGNYCRRDGYADSYSIAHGFGTAAVRLGAELRLRSEVLAIHRKKDRVFGVATAAGDFHSPRIVNAGGPYAGLIGTMAGIDVPVQPVRRMLLMTEEFPEVPLVTPMFIDADTGFLMRSESGRVLMGWSDPNEPAGFNEALDPNFAEVVAEKAIRRVPVLEEATINLSKSWAGLYEESPDHHSILGMALGLEGFYLANGFSGHGMMHSPAAGMILADLILDGRTDTLDPRPLRHGRFAEGELVHEAVVL